MFINSLFQSVSLTKILLDNKMDIINSNLNDNEYVISSSWHKKIKFGPQITLAPKPIEFLSPVLI